MNNETEHPFVPGARVAVSERHGDGVTENFVEKVYKTGRFTLKGSSQQWRPWRTVSYQGRANWSASETGDGWTRRRLDIWDTETDKEISQKVERSRAKQRWNIIRSKVDAVREPTAALCDAVEAALSQGKTP